MFAWELSRRRAPNWDGVVLKSMPLQPTQSQICESAPRSGSNVRSRRSSFLYWTVAASAAIALIVWVWISLSEISGTATQRNTDLFALGSSVRQVLTPADPALLILRSRLPRLAKGTNSDDLAAISAFYEKRSGSLVWVTAGGYTDKANAAIREIRNADDWGLRARDFLVPQLPAGNVSAQTAAEAEIKLALTLLKYARYARGGRVIAPSRISKLLDHTPPIHPPKLVLNEITAVDAPDAYLRSLHPKHEQFRRLRKKLLMLRGTGHSVEFPPGAAIQTGMEDRQVALLRKRLKVPADPGQENIYDVELREVVQAFQRTNGLSPDGVFGNQTRALLNRASNPRGRKIDQSIQRILINMERWRWMPTDLEAFYIWNNVPEFLTRVVKNGRIIHTDKIVAGQPTWPTPSFSADMKTVVFHPSWGVPNGIKTRELWPLLRKSSGGGLFGFLGGGYSSQAVLDAHNLRAYYRGREIDANQVNWNSIDIRAYNFRQPPGPKNVLGTVKFMFPNKHDVYMHDTPERKLFARSFRGLSHGCMRVQQPRRLAEIILAEDKGWSAEQVRDKFNGYSQEVSLRTHIPVHVTYFTAVVDDHGEVKFYGDLYGLDSRVGTTLLGRHIRFETPRYDDVPIASNSPNVRLQRQKQYTGPQTLADAISDLFSP